MRNEDFLTRLLKPMGFEVHVLGGKSIREQAELFSSAQVVVTEHGAQLTNLIWCSPGTIIVDIHPGHEAVPCFELLSRQLELDYRGVFEAAERHYENGDWDIAPLAVDKIAAAVRDSATRPPRVTCWPGGPGIWRTPSRNRARAGSRPS